MVHVLDNRYGFVSVAEAMGALGLELRDVRSCTFPSRPEPRAGRWCDGQLRPCWRYVYEPDLEVRVIWRVANLEEVGLGADFDLRAFCFATLGHTLFALWPDLQDALMQAEHRACLHGAAAWRVRAELTPHAEVRAQCAEVLGQALASEHVAARRAASEQLIRWCPPELEPLLVRAREDDDLMVRAHAHDALDRLRARTLR